MNVYRLWLLVGLSLICSCSPSATSGGIPAPLQAGAATRQRVRSASGTPIRHVVVVIQENRTVDDLFQFFPGANTASTCTDAQGNVHNLISVPLENGAAGLSHTHDAFLEDLYPQWNGLPGGSLGPASNTGWVAQHCAYVPKSEAQPYYNLAQAYTFANNFFQTNQGPSYPAHLYLVSGTSACTGGSLAGPGGPVYRLCAPPTPWPVSDNPADRDAGCDAPAGSSVSLVSPTDTTVYSQQGVFPCFTQPTIIDEAQAAGLSWLFYQANSGPGYWHTVDSVGSVWCMPSPFPCAGPGSRYRANVRVPSPQGSDVAAKFISDLGTCGTLANITYITPDKAESDHAGMTDGSGPSYVTNIVNAIGKSCFWKNTAVIIVWDDWGGWFDHLCPGGGTNSPCPTPRSSYELGYRVPMIIVSPYAKSGYVTSNEYDFGSILLYLENTFNLPSLGTADAVANDFTTDIFNYARRPTQFASFKAPRSRAWFAHVQRHDPPGTLVPDDDTDKR